MSRHDSAYRSLFARPVMMAELLRGIVRQDWVAQLDLSTLERINAEHVSARGARRRASDMIWRAVSARCPSRYASAWLAPPMASWTPGP